MNNKFLFNLNFIFLFFCNTAYCCVTSASFFDFENKKIAVYYTQNLNNRDLIKEQIELFHQKINFFEQSHFYDDQKLLVLSEDSFDIDFYRLLDFYQDGYSYSSVPFFSKKINEIGLSSNFDHEKIKFINIDFKKNLYLLSLAYDSLFMLSDKGLKELIVSQIKDLRLNDIFYFLSDRDYRLISREKDRELVLKNLEEIRAIFLRNHFTELDLEKPIYNLLCENVFKMPSIIENLTELIGFCNCKKYTKEKAQFLISFLLCLERKCFSLDLANISKILSSIQEADDNSKIVIFIKLDLKEFLEEKLLNLGFVKTRSIEKTENLYNQTHSIDQVAWNFIC